MWHLERELRKTGDPHDQERADVVAAMLKARGKDIPTPQVSALKEAASVEVKQFSDEVRSALIKEGHVIYQLAGQSIQDQIVAGRRFGYVVDAESVRTLPSRTGEIAFNPEPKKFFIPKSNNKTLNQQLAMIADYSQRLQEKLKSEDLEAIMGQVPDYTSAIFLHFDATDKRLFGNDYGFNYARTQTPTGESRVARVGSFGAAPGPRVRDWARDDGDGHVFAAPLVVPK